jgi:hypothetical protein
MGEAPKRLALTVASNAIPLLHHSLLDNHHSILQVDRLVR